MPKTETRSAVATPHYDSTTKKKMTQDEKVLHYMQEHGSITSWDAFVNLKITRLSGRIYDLREQGYDIDMNYEVTENGTRYGIYTLKEDGHEIAASR